MIVEKEIDSFGEQYQAVFSTDFAKTKGSIGVYINHTENSRIGGYVYSIGDRRSGEVYGVVLQDSSDEMAVEHARSLGRILVKKYGLPAYTCISGSVSNFGHLLQSVMAVIEGIKGGQQGLS